MKTKKYKFISAILFVSIFYSSLSAQEKNDKIDNFQAIDMIVLKQAAVPIKSIDFKDDDFSDLLPLAKKIGKARIVMLGEGTHAEGTTTRAKARLVRFLHEKMNFDVLMWESGMFSAYALNEKLRDVNFPFSEARTYLSTWGFEEDAQPLLEYTRTSWQTKRPLIMAGIDRSRTSPSADYFAHHFRQFFERASTLKWTDDEWKIAGTFAARAFTLQKPKDQLPPVEQRKAERDFFESFLLKLKSARQQLKKNFSSTELEFAEKFIEDALAAEEFNYLAATDFQSSNPYRDKMMGENLMWQLKTLYPKKKIIVWAATSHLIRNSEQIKNTTEGWTHPAWYMGNRIYPALQKQIYTIAFTANSGTYGLTFTDPNRQSQTGEMKEAPIGSFEAAASALGKPYLFVDLKNAPAASRLHESFISLALGRDINQAKWRDSVDAFFFINIAEPRKLLN